MTTLLVYGTLKKGRYNHARFGMDKLSFLGKGEIKDYSLVQPSGVPFPFLIPNIGGTVRGELYEVPDDLLDVLDRMERGAGYKRIQVKLEDSLETVNVYVDGKENTYPNLPRFEEF